MTATRHGIPHSLLAERSVYLGAPHHNETYDFLGALIVHLCHQHAYTRQDRNTLRRLLYIDEGLITFGDNNRIDGPVLVPLIPLLREYGTAVAISTAHLGGIHETLRANMYTTIVLRLANATDASLAARTLGLNAAQAEHLLRLNVGQAIVRTGKAQTPFVITFPPPTRDKTVDERAWQHAIERTNRLAPKDHTSTPRTTIMPATTTVPMAPPPTQPLIAHNTAPTTPIAPNNPVVAAPVLPIALSTAEQSLLSAVDKLVIPTSVVAYRAGGLTLQAGDRAAKHTEALGVLTREPITAHQERGGRAIALQLTNAGYDRLDKKPPHGLRAGSSAQHTYLAINLARHLPDARIETTLGGQGGKSIDLLLRLTDKHQRLLHVLNDQAERFAVNHPPLASGDLVAIEVETTADTVANNIRKNLAAGIAHNITAVMPKALPTAKKVILKDIPSEQLPRVLLINVFTLLEALQEQTS